MLPANVFAINNRVLCFRPAKSITHSLGSTSQDLPIHAIIRSLIVNKRHKIPTGIQSKRQQEHRFKQQEAVVTLPRNAPGRNQHPKRERDRDRDIYLT